MFTGIILAVGRVRSVGETLVIEVDWDAVVMAGDSVAVNGCCLTHVGGNNLSFNLSEESLNSTMLGSLAVGSEVNLEPSLRVGDRVGGHFVLGHVDGVGEFIGRDRERFRFRIPIDGAKYLVDKGSVAVNGVSLTVNDPDGDEFWAAIIPYTETHTNFGSMLPGSKVNIEFDILARHVEKIISLAEE